jgi:hypothetical protein
LHCHRFQYFSGQYDVDLQRHTLARGAFASSPIPRFRRPRRPPWPQSSAPVPLPPPSWPASLLERPPDELEGRGARLLTPEGRRALRGLRSRKTAYPAERPERHDPEERAVQAQASELLERLLEDGGE